MRGKLGHRVGEKISHLLLMVKTSQKHQQYQSTLISKRLKLQNSGWYERSLRADFIPHMVFTFSSKNSRDIWVFVQAYAPFIIL